MIDTKKKINEVLSLSVRTKAALFRSGFVTIGYLADRTERELRVVDGLGAGGIAEIKMQLALVGLSLQTSRIDAEEHNNAAVIQLSGRTHRLRRWLENDVIEKSVAEIDAVEPLTDAVRDAITKMAEYAERITEALPCIFDGKQDGEPVTGERVYGHGK